MGVVGGRVGEAVEPVTVQPGTVTAARSAWCSGNGTVTASIDGAPHAATSCWLRPARPSTAASPWPGAGLRKIGRRGYRRWRLLGGQVAAQKTVGSASTTRASAVPVAATLVAVAAGCWWGTLRAPMMTAATLPAFLVAWLAMMAAMMMPAVAPAVRLYLRASARTAAPAPWFVGGYLAVWTAVGVPAYFAWRLLAPAVMDGRPWVGRAAGAALLVAAGYQLSPVKDACLSRRRSDRCARKQRRQVSVQTLFTTAPGGELR